MPPHFPYYHVNLLRCVLDGATYRKLYHSHRLLEMTRRQYSKIDPCGGGAAGGSGKKHSIAFKPYVAPCFKDHDHKNMALKRPMSPHLTVYGPTLPAMTSIGQRITGTIVTFYALMLSGGALFLTNGVDTYVSMIQSLDLSGPLVFLIKIVIGVPFTYHYFCGIRFVAWTAGKWLNMKTVYSTAHKTFVLTGVVALLFALL